MNFIRIQVKQKTVKSKYLFNQIYRYYFICEN